MCYVSGETYRSTSLEDAVVSLSWAIWRPLDQIEDEAMDITRCRADLSRMREEALRQEAAAVAAAEAASESLVPEVQLDEHIMQADQRYQEEMDALLLDVEQEYKMQKAVPKRNKVRLNKNL